MASNGNPRFDELFAAGSRAVLEGAHHSDTPPADGGRWGLAVVLRPQPPCLDAFAALTTQILDIAGGHHWPTGSPAVSHFTVRSLEPFRADVPDGDEAVKRYAAAMERAAACTRPVRLAVRGLTLTPSCVMACAEPEDGTAPAFAAALAEELGDDGWYEAGFDRTIWYSTLVHFAGPIAQPAGLVQWVAEHRKTFIAQAFLPVTELIRYRHNGRHTELESLATARQGPSR
jgi:hypothetical protein